MLTVMTAEACCTCIPFNDINRLHILITMWCPSHPDHYWRPCCTEKSEEAPSWIFNLALLHREYRCGMWLRSDVGRSSKTGSNQPVISVKAACSRVNHFVVNSQSTTTNCGKTSIRKRVTSSIMGCSLFQTPLIHNRSRQTMTAPNQDQFKILMTK